MKIREISKDMIGKWCDERGSEREWRRERIKETIQSYDKPILSIDFKTRVYTSE